MTDPGLSHAYTLGACYAKPFDEWHAGCEICDEARGYLARPETAVEFTRGRREQESWLRMFAVRRAYGRRRRYW